MSTEPYDALLLVSFGGPEGPEDVMGFLENVTRGRNVPRARLAEVGEHYLRFGGVSPINQQCRDLIAAIEVDFAGHGLDLPVYWGNRNWKPYLADTMRRMADDGIRRAIAFVTAAYGSYSSCRQYREDIAGARAAVGSRAPRVDKLRHYFNHPGFVEPMVDATLAALHRLPEEVRGEAHLAFTAHSIPTQMAEHSGPRGGEYVRGLADAARLVQERVDGGTHPWELVFQSRSGPPGQPWLEPDVGDHLDVLHCKGVRSAVLVPIGFVSDHLEIKYDLDVEAMDRAGELGIHLARVATVGTEPRFVAMVRELVLERMTPDAPRRALGTLGPSHDECPRECCRYEPARPMRSGA
ncbi:MAG: ferrochelatase [Streptosporangiales bacterium]|nr:ferrochelatase [Streptosporangiales bacterium]